MLYVEVIIYHFCEYLFCIYILLCTCDDTRGTLCNNQWVRYVCMYICDITRTLFLKYILCVIQYLWMCVCVVLQFYLCESIFGESCNVCIYICVWGVSIFIVVIVRVYVYMLKHYERSIIYYVSCMCVLTCHISILINILII